MKKEVGPTSPNTTSPSERTSSIQQQLQVALDAAEMGIWEWDMELNSVTWSEQVYKLFDMSPADPIDFENYLKYIHPEDKELVIKTIEDTISAGSTYFVQHRFFNPKKEIRWLEAKGKVYRDDHGKPVKMIGTVVDVTERKLIEIEREDWKIRYELIVSSSGQLIYDYDLVSGAIVWGGDTLGVLGFSKEEMGDIDHWVEMIHPIDREFALLQLQRAEESLRKYNVRYRFKTSSGQYVHIHDSGLFLVKDQKAFRMLGTMVDITAQLEVQRTLEEKNLFIESITNAIPDVVHVLDLKNLDLVFSNRSLLGSLGYSTEEVEAFKGDLSPIYKESSEVAYQHFRDRFVGVKDELVQYEVSILAKSGEWRWFSCQYRVFKQDANGETTQVIGTIRDIHQQKIAIEALQQSEERFRTLIRDLQVGVLLQGAQSEVLVTNQAALDLLGLSEEQVLGKTSLDVSWNVIHEDGAPFPGEHHPVVVAIKTKTSVRGIVMGVFRPAMNDRVWLLVNAEPIVAESGELLHVVCTFADITDIRNMKEELKQSELRYKTLQEASFGGIALHDGGIILDCNMGLSDLTGYSYDELVGMNGLLLLAPEFRDLALHNIKTDFTRPYDAEALHQDGSRYFVEVRGRTVPYMGRIIRVTEFRDITERKRSAQRIVEQNQKLVHITDDLRHKNDQLEEFTQIVSHNLRSPVGNIVSLLNYYDQASDENEKQEYISLLRESGQNTLLTLNELNEVLKIKGNLAIEKQELLFERVLMNVRSMLVVSIAESGATIEADFSQEPVIQYPHIYLESILLNLLSNSLKYRHEKRKPYIQLRTYQQNGSIWLSVLDNGLGIDLERYGHQLFRMRKTFHRHPESRGVGLFLIKNQINAMGGEITAESKVNEGITFTIKFN